MKADSSACSVRNRPSEESEREISDDTSLRGSRMIS